eukprot:45958_1
MAADPDFSAEGQTNIDYTSNVKYEFVSVDSVFNAIQFQLLLIDLRDAKHYNQSHIRQSFDFCRLQSISVSSEKRLFFNNDTHLPIYIYHQHMFDKAHHTDELHAICEMLVLNAWVKDTDTFTVHILQSGFDAFHKLYPFECTQTVLNTPYRYRGSVYPNIVTHNALYYGNAEQASDGNVIQHLNITHIVNITNQDFEIDWKNGDAKEGKETNIKYLKLPIHDNEDHQISVYFDTANRFINDALLDENHRVLVHCMFGSSRSGTILVQYLMNKEKISLYAAYKYVYECRPCLYPNESFMNELENAEIVLFGVDKKASSRRQIEASHMR